MFEKWNILLIFVLINVVSVRMEECVTKNITCRDIRTSAGYKFDLESKNRKAVAEMEITQNETSIVYGEVGSLTCSTEIKCDEKSITTPTCSSVYVKFIYKDEGGKISDSCLIINTTEDTDEETHSSIALYLSGSVLGAVAVVALVCVPLDWFLWRKRQKKKGACATFPDYLSRPRRTCFNNKQTTYDTHEDASVRENRRNYDQEQLRLLFVKSGNTETMDVSINMDPNENITKDDEHQVLNGNLGHNPGGGKDTEQHCNRTLEQRTLGEQRFHTKNGRLLSRNQRSAREEASDKTAVDKGQELVNSSGPGIESNAPPYGVGKDTHDKEEMIVE